MQFGDLSSYMMRLLKKVKAYDSSDVFMPCPPRYCSTSKRNHAAALYFLTNEHHDGSDMKKYVTASSAPNLYGMLEDAGLAEYTDSWNTDLYVKKTPEVTAIIDEWRKLGGIGDVSTFTDAIDHEPWYEIPFAYTPAWENRLRGKDVDASTKVTASGNINPIAVDAINALQSAQSILNHLIDEGALADFDAWNPTRDSDDESTLRFYNRVVGFESKALNKINGALDDISDALAELYKA